MKRFFQSRLILTLAAFTIVAAAIVIPLSNSTVHTHAQSQLLPYPTAVLADSPVLYYRLGDPPGSTVAVDSSGNGHNGVYAGGVTLGQPGALAGDPDTSAAFDGSTGIVDSGTNVISTSSTIEAWIQPTHATCPDPSCSAGQSAIAGTGGSFQLTFGRVPGEVRVWLWPQDNSGWIFLDAPTSIPLNKWTYVATTWDDTTKQLSIYINGTLSASLPLPGVISSYQSFNSLPFTFNLAGFEPAPQQQYQGGLDEVAYYNHALSADRILAHYKAATQPTGPDLFLTETRGFSFPVGENGLYTLTVTNAGDASTTGPITVTDTLPDGLTFSPDGTDQLNTGTNWTCSAVSQDVTCMNPGPLAVNDSTTLQVVVNVPWGLSDVVLFPDSALVTNTAMVSTQGDTNLPEETASSQARVCMPSGELWVKDSPWPQDKNPADLSNGPVDFFGPEVQAFFNALAVGGAAPAPKDIIATYRAPQRAYLMKFSRLVANNQEDPRLVPPFPGPSQAERVYPLYSPPDIVNICWVHTDSTGMPDILASQGAAAAMVALYHLSGLVAYPTNHSVGNAIDMNIRWKDTLTIKCGPITYGICSPGSLVQIKAQHVGQYKDTQDLNPGLWDVGRSYGVIHLLVGYDPPHWSINGT